MTMQTATVIETLNAMARQWCRESGIPEENAPVFKVASAHGDEVTVSLKLRGLPMIDDPRIAG